MLEHLAELPEDKQANAQLYWDIVNWG